MKKHLALGIAGASAALIGGWRLVRQLADRDGETDAVAVAPGMPAEPAAADAVRPEETTPERKGSTEPANTTPASTGASKKSSKAELYEIAQELDIEGRSKMTKDELLKAIEDAG